MIKQLQTIASTARAYGFLYALKRLRQEFTYRVNKLLRRKLAKVEIHDFYLLIDMDDPGISEHLYKFGDREQQLGHILRTEIKQDFSVLDLGANIGYYALLERSLVGQ